MGTEQTLFGFVMAETVMVDGMVSCPYCPREIGTKRGLGTHIGHI